MSGREQSPQSFMQFLIEEVKQDIRSGILKSLFSIRTMNTARPFRIMSGYAQTKTRSAFPTGF